MQVQIDPHSTILAYGIFTVDHEDPGISIVEIDDSQLDTLQQPGIKTLEADGTISVAPDLAAQAAELARQQAIADAEAQHRTDAENVMALFPNATPEQVQSFLRLANVTL